MFVRKNIPTILTILCANVLHMMVTSR